MIISPFLLGHLDFFHGFWFSLFDCCFCVLLFILQLLHFCTFVILLLGRPIVVKYLQITVKKGIMCYGWSTSGEIVCKVKRVFVTACILHKCI